MCIFLFFSLCGPLNGRELYTSALHECWIRSSRVFFTIFGCSMRNFTQSIFWRSRSVVVEQVPWMMIFKTEPSTFSNVQLLSKSFHPQKFTLALYLAAGLMPSSQVPWLVTSSIREAKQLGSDSSSSASRPPPLVLTKQSFRHSGFAIACPDSNLSDMTTQSHQHSSCKRNGSD